ncbi:efflux pump [Colletotrichum higginsianum]|nr:efflux pump [Colletotrichum higginsianum]
MGFYKPGFPVAKGRREQWSLIGFILFFEIGSLLCGIASSSAMLILGRAVAGMGGSGLLIGNQTVIAGLAPLEKRPVAAPGMLLGPIVGGIITEYSTWRWIFYMNLPIGAVAILLLVFTGIPEQTAKPDWRIVLRGLHHYFDILGCSLCTAATCLLLLVLNIGGDLLPWNSPILIGMFVFSVILFAFFVYWSAHMGHRALMPPSIAKQRVVWSGAATLMFTIGATTVQSYFLPLYFQSVRGESALTGALYTIPGLPGQILFSLASGFLIGKIGYYLPWALVGTAVHTVACGLLSRFSTATPTPYWILSQFLAGCGRGMSLQSPSIAAQIALPQDQISIASSIVTFGMYLGSALASTAASVAFDNVLRTEVERRVSNAAAADIVLTGGATEFRHVLSGDELASALDAFAGGLRGVFLLATGLSGVSFLFAWGMRSSNAGTQRTEEGNVKETKGVIGDNAN